MRPLFFASATSFEDRAAILRAPIAIHSLPLRDIATLQRRQRYRRRTLWDRLRARGALRRTGPQQRAPCGYAGCPAVIDRQFAVDEQFPDADAEFARSHIIGARRILRGIEDEHIG